MSYFQKKYRVSKRTGQIIIEIVKAIVLEVEIDNIFWPKIILAMIYIQNLWSIRALEGTISPIKNLDNIIFSFQHL